MRMFCSAADTEKTQRFSSLIKVTVMFILLWQSILMIANTSDEVLLKCMKILLPFFTDCDHTKNSFPKSLLQAHRLLQLNQDDFQSLVVCPKCHTTYEKQDCRKLNFVVMWSFPIIIDAC